MGYLIFQVKINSRGLVYSVVLLLGSVALTVSSFGSWAGTSCALPSMWILLCPPHPCSEGHTSRKFNIHPRPRVWASTTVPFQIAFPSPHPSAPSCVTPVSRPRRGKIHSLPCQYPDLTKDRQGRSQGAL